MVKGIRVTLEGDANDYVGKAGCQWVKVSVSSQPKVLGAVWREIGKVRGREVRLTRDIWVTLEGDASDYVCKVRHCVWSL